MLRLERDGDDWLVGNNRLSRLSLEALTPDVREKLSVLVTAPIGFRDARIGRRVSNTVFWIFEKE